MTAPGGVYPWQRDLQARVAKLRATDKLPHALLLSGPKNLGKRDFALATAGFMLCNEPVDGARCGQCDNCKLFAAGTHPDFRLISPEESRLIKIEQIRDLIDWLSQTAQRGGARTVVIDPAEQMNVYSANALLKCLEEPGANTLIMLVSDLPGRLLPTIRSRCQHLDFSIPAKDEALAWLASNAVPGTDLEGLLSIAGGAPLAVVNEYDEAYLKRRAEVVKSIRDLVAGANPLDVAKTLSAGVPEQDLALIYGLFADALRFALTQQGNIIKNKDIVDDVAVLSEKLGNRGLIDAVDAVSRERRAAASSSNPNIQLLFESLAIEIAGHCSL